MKAINRDDDTTHVYANRGKTIAEVSAHSLKCLQPSKYLNDEVIQFYLAYLIHEQYPSDNTRKVHVFDNIFHKILTETFKQVIDVPKWMALDKWLNNVYIFENDFLIFPVCQEEHWLAIIVCHPNEVRPFDEKGPSPDSTDSKNRPVPGIIVLDSLGLKNQLVTKHVRDFLDFEWRTRASVIKSFHWVNLQQYQPVLPKQTNAYDCGLFMLAYLTAFIRNPEKFYRYVRMNSDSESEKLSEMVNEVLVDCSRESIRNLITRKCEVKRHSPSGSEH